MIQQHQASRWWAPDRDYILQAGLTFKDAFSEGSLLIRSVKQEIEYPLSGYGNKQEI